MNSKQIGNIGEAFVIAKFVESGIPVYTSFGDNEKADLIIDLKGRLLKVQVKTSDRLSNDSIKFNACSTRGLKSKQVFYTDKDVDLFALYSIQTKDIYIVPFKEASNYDITLRLQPSKNNQKIGIKFAKDYIFEKQIAAFA